MATLRKDKDKIKRGIAKLLAMQPYPKETDYYVDAKSWYVEVYESVLCSRDRYRLLAICFGVFFLIALIIIMFLVPLKRYYYRILEVNTQTGEVSELKEMENKAYPATWLETRYFLNQYVQNRESYFWDDLKRRFNIVLAMSDQTIADSYLADTIDSNPKSPLNIFKQNFTQDVTDFTANQLNDNTALIRFKLTTKNKDNPTDIKNQDWQVVVKWKYLNPAESLKERDKNPLGFKVTYYQKSPVFVGN